MRVTDSSPKSVMVIVVFVSKGEIAFCLCVLIFGQDAD